MGLRQVLEQLHPCSSPKLQSPKQVWSSLKTWKAEVTVRNLTSHHWGQQSGGFSQVNRARVPWLDSPPGGPTPFKSRVGKTVRG